MCNSKGYCVIPVFAVHRVVATLACCTHPSIHLYTSASLDPLFSPSPWKYDHLLYQFLIRRTHGSLLNAHTISVEKIELLRKDHRCACVNPFRPYRCCLQLSASQWRCPGFLHNSSQCVHLTFGVNRNVYPLVHGHFCLMW